MRPSRLLALIAICAVPVLAGPCLSAASLSEVRERIHPGEQVVQDVDLSGVLAAPQSFLNVRIRFHALFVENGNLFDTLRTAYKPECFFNLILWDAQADIWNPQVRAQPVTTAFLSKDRADATKIAGLRKYQLLELTGEVTGVIDGQPLFSIHSFDVAEGADTYSETGLYHIQQADGLAAESSYDLAEDHFAAALGGELPAGARQRIAFHRAQNLAAWGHYDACAKVLRDLLEGVSEAAPLDRKMLAVVHYLLAKALAEGAAADASAEARSARYSEAVSHARTAVELDPEQGDAYAVLGITLAGMGQFDEARRQCEKAIRLRPNNAEVRWYLGRILDQQGSYDEAIDALRKAIDITPKDHRIHKAIGAVYLHRAQKGGASAAADLVIALREYEIAVRLNPADPEGSFGAGQVLEAATAAKADILVGSERKPATAAMATDAYLKAVAADPKFIPARRALIARYRADNNQDAALVQLAGLAEAQGNNFDSYAELADFQVSLGKKAEAYQTWEKAAKAFPKDARVPAQLGHLANELGKPEVAAGWLMPLYAADDRNAEVALDLATAKLALNLPKEALRIARRAESVSGDEALKEKARTIQQQAQTALDAPAH
ncbi:MAG: tetratricopeptide repeat protein [Planctomycetes bacterium]|nr:tetratricopeptide repeat protein [Planctomycetota bacterium]